MKTFSILSTWLALTALVSCQKPQSEEQKNAEIERQVQQRLAAEHQAQEQQQLTQREADLDAREKALAEKESAASSPEGTTTPRQVLTSIAHRMRDSSGNPATANYTTFYTKLEPYGAWLETNDYGYVWQPREAEGSRNWRPYTNGRWVYTDAGWTWISDEPFGWAAYHYGRWTRLRGIGWVWVPGDQWAPAWVSWRKSNDYIGWAPLPPEARFDQRVGIHNWADNYYDIGPEQYSFVPTKEFGAQRMESTVVPRERNVTIINETTNVTNITYDNERVVNQGPNYDEVRARSREPLQRLRIERNLNLDVNSEAIRPVVKGDVIVIAAPGIAAPQPNERPATVKQTITQTSADLGWEGIADTQAAEKARAKIKAEAAPPANAPSKTFVKPAVATGRPAETAAAPMASASPAPSPVETESAAPSTPTPPQETSSAHTPEKAATATPTPLPTSTSSPLPTASERRGRLLVPSTPARRETPLPKSTASASSTSVSSATVKPKPSATVTPAAAGDESPSPPPAQKPGEFQSQTQKRYPRRIVPMPSPPSSQASTLASSPTSNVASSPSASASEKLPKKEKKEQKREEKEEKRERRAGMEKPKSESPSPSATP